MLTLLIILCITASAFDLMVRRIPNWLNALIFLNAILYWQLDTQSGFNSLIFSLLLIVPLLLFAFAKNKIGAGDVKMIIAILPMLKITALTNFILVSALSGGVLAIICLIIAKFRGGLTSVPYGIAIGIGGVTAVWLASLT